MDNLDFKFQALVWVYSGKGAWHFVTLPKDAAEGIRFFNTAAKGFMPIAVRAQIGETVWKTSVFPDSKSGSYVLALKAAVRKAENISDGDTVSVCITVAMQS
jgi:Domain of unknown function (DUF1905)